MIVQVGVNAQEVCETQGNRCTVKVYGLLPDAIHSIGKCMTRSLKADCDASSPDTPCTSIPDNH